MCIRDRSLISDCDRFLSDLSTNIILPKPVFGAPDPAKPGACLLYTSDAADERSSVDLGGRRIIKKKKRVDIYCSRAKTQKTPLHRG